VAWTGTRRDFAIVQLGVPSGENVLANIRLDLFARSFTEGVAFWFWYQNGIPSPLVGRILQKDSSGTSSSGREYVGKIACFFSDVDRYRSDCNGQLLVTATPDRITPIGILWGHNWPQLLFIPLDSLFDSRALERGHEAYVWRQLSFPHEIEECDPETDDERQQSRSMQRFLRVLSWSPIPSEIP
jgi:hypothetical protein